MAKKIFYIMSDSINSWFPYFFSNNNFSEVIVCNLPLDNKIVEEVKRIESLYGKAVDIYVISSHISLKRDVSLVRQFRKKGYNVFAQSDIAVDYGTNKIYQKRMFEENKYSTPKWSLSLKEINNNYLVKSSNATEAKGVVWYKNKLILRKDVYYEEYVSGAEYSVNIFSNKTHSIIFPAVYKGTNTKDLKPPYMRIRLCGKYNKQIKQCETKMQNIALELGKEINNYGFMEVEFLVDDKGEVYILEINPRVSGTLRIASLATGNKCFDLLLQTGIPQNKLKAKYNTYEIPHEGITLLDDKNDIYCTSRLTFIANSDNEVEYKLRLVEEKKVTMVDIKNKRKGILANY